MPTRDEIINALKQQDATSNGPSRGDMILALKQQDKPFEAKGSNVSEAESTVRGAAQGASLGFADEISGGAEALWEKAKGDPTAFGELYKKFRDESRSNFKKAQDANPDEYLAGEVTGAVGTAFVPGMGGANLVKLAAMGGAAGLGASESETIGGQLVDTGKGIVTGAALGAAGKLAGAGASKVLSKARQPIGETLKEFAEERAFKALGPVKKHADEALAKGNLKQIGRQALDEKIVTPLASKEKMLDRISEKITSTADELDSVLDKVQSGAGLSADGAAKLESAKFVPAKAAEEIKSLIRAKYPDIPAKVLEPRLNVIDDWLSSDKAMSIKSAQSFKKQMNDFINDKSYWMSNPNASQEALVGVQSSIRKGIEKNADAYAEAVGEKAGQVKQTNKKLGNFLEMEDIVDDRLSRNSVNRSVSPSDYAAGGLSGIASKAKDIKEQGLIMGGAMLANNAARTYGNNLLAAGADKISKHLLKSPKLAELSKKNPAAFKALVTQISQRASTKQALPMVADEPKESAQAPLKGFDKWANDGIEKLKGQGANLDFESLKKNPKAKELLAQLSDLKPNSKAFNDVVLKIKKIGGQGNG